MVKPKLGS